MSRLEVHFSSQRMDWKTPKAVYQLLDAEFHFDYDPCPTDPKVDGLTTEWGKCNYVNPPYGKDQAKWIAKAYEQYKLGKTVVLLIPSRTDTISWHEYCMKATEIRFIRGRLYFDDGEGRAPFPSAIVIFDSGSQGGAYGDGYRDGYATAKFDCLANLKHKEDKE